MIIVGFIRREFDHYVYFKKKVDNNVIIYRRLYVDNVLLIGDNISNINKIKRIFE